MTAVRFAALLAALVPPTVSAAERPSVVVVMTDDQGYGDLGCHGNPVLRTPHLDAWHNASARLTDFHVAPMCTPTRGQLLTGLDAMQNRAMNVSSGRCLLRTDVPTLASTLAAAGYRTGLFGKWHLGDNRPFRPQDRGFGTATWFPSSHVFSLPDAWENDYFDDTFRVFTDGRFSQRAFEGYCTDVFFREAIDWIGSPNDGESEQPFFAYIATNAAHWPHWVPEEAIEAVRPRFDAAEADGSIGALEGDDRESLIRFLAMIENIDQNVGRLVGNLEAAGRLDDTLLVFLTDNGSTFGHRYFPAGMRGKKTQLWEGGHRVPCFLRHPSFGTPRDIAGLTHVQDLMPTILDMCGVSPLDGPALDGISLKPVLTDDEPLPDRTLVINYSRMPRAKGPTGQRVASQPSKDGAAVLWRRWRWLNDRELYDLASDPMQQHDLASQHPDIAAKLSGHLDAWWSDITAEGDPAEPLRVTIDGRSDDGVDRSGQRITACEWLDVFVDQQLQVRYGAKRFGVWHLDIERPGRYDVQLRRWPAESGLALTDGIGQTEATSGTMTAGPGFPIAGAEVYVNRADRSQRQATPTRREGNALVATIDLPAGPVSLEAVFIDGEGKPIAGAYEATLVPLD